MKVLLDTSVLVAALVKSHVLHARAQPWLDRAHAGKFEFIVSTHSFADVYSTLTNLPHKPRITPLEARDLVRENIQRHAKPVALEPSDYDAVLDRMARLGIQGGPVYDALIARTAEKADADRLLTLNLRHFLRVWPEGASVIREP